MTIDASCPNCGTVFTVRRELIGKRTKCTRCGVPFVIAEPVPGPPRFESAACPPADVIFPESPTQFSAAPAAPAAQRQSPPPGSGNRGLYRESFGFERDQSLPGFPALKIVARSYEVMAVFVLVVAAVLLILFLISAISMIAATGELRAIIPAILGTGLGFFWATVTALTFLFIAQLIRLSLQIEQNTRATSDAVRRLADHLCSIEVEK